MLTTTRSPSLAAVVSEYAPSESVVVADDSPPSMSPLPLRSTVTTTSAPESALPWPEPDDPDTRPWAQRSGPL
jgi:hypothetical protein